jgi:phosphoribosylglycinamide formyltransferase-1
VDRIAVLLSGRGSNFEAIYRANVAQIVCVVSNRPEAPGIVRARELGLTAHVFDHRKYPTREAHEEDVLRAIAESEADFIVLAGYMRLLSPAFVAAYPHRILNIHPSLLPAFPGVDAQAQALRYGVKVAGCTVHFVDENLDAGPIIVQRAVPVLDGDTAESLAARILEQEHVAYPEALRALSTKKWRVEGRRVVFD